jgi:hypothetical protein
MSDCCREHVERVYRTVEAETQRLLTAESERRTALRRAACGAYGAEREKLLGQIEHSNGVADGLIAASHVFGRTAFPKPPTG